MDTALEILDSTAELVNADSKYLEYNGINQWIDIPLWISNNYFTFDNRKILNRYNLKFTDFKDSLIETIEYCEKTNWPIPHYGIDRKTQSELIRHLQIKQGS